MPKSKHSFGRYLVIDRELRKNPCVKTKEIQTIILNEFGLDVTTRQIELDIEAMRSDSLLGYNAPIQYNHHYKAWEYSDRNYSINKFNLKDEEIIALKFHAATLNQYKEHGLFKDFSNVLQKVVEAVDINSKINPASNSKLIVQTDNLTPGKGGQFLGIIAEAIDKRNKIEFKYKKFGDKKSKLWKCEPYLLKEYRNRWYIICKIPTFPNAITFALDRISAIHIINESFQIDTSFNLEKLFKYSFGITTLDESPEKINLLFTQQQANYIKSLPIHKSQKTVKQAKSGTEVSIKIIPSYEFYEYILGQGANVKVLSPKWIKVKIKDFHKRAFARYNQ